MILIALVLFIYESGDIARLFKNVKLPHIFIIVLTVILVHTIKAIRLYIALYGSDIKLLQYIKVYCKVTPISIIFPFKLGEFFRMYCYGYSISNMLKGAIIVLLDRFMDTVALVTTIFIVWFFIGGKITTLIYFLLIFLVVVMLIYLTFPGVYTFWKKYILSAKATKNRIGILKSLDALNKIYQVIKSVTKGKGIIIYFMSLIAWAVEIGSIYIQSRLIGDFDLNAKISNYLSSAMGSAQSLELKQFVFISVVILIVVYVVTAVVKAFSEKRASK